MQAEKQRAESQMELEELMLQVNDVQGEQNAQAELSRKRDGEMARLRRQIEVGRIKLVC